MLSSTTNHQSFKDHFGVNHVTAAQIWEYLQTTGVTADNLTVKKPKNKKDAEGSGLIVTLSRIFE